MSANDTHRIYLECVRPDIGKKGMNKYYLVERNGYKVTIKYGSINQKNSDGIPIKGTTTVKTFPSVQKASIFMSKQVNDKLRPKGKTMKDSKTQMMIPKPPYKIVSEKKGFVDLSTLRGRLGIMNHVSMDMA
jgi:predicted DNA-binding WGR domain protein